MHSRLAWFHQALVVYCLSVCFASGLQAQDSERRTTQELNRLIGQYVPVELTADLRHLSENQKELIRLLISAGDLMDECFWYEAYGDRGTLLSGLSDAEKNYVALNYGPWDRLDGNQPFIGGVTDKPRGANFYPSDMTEEEFQAAELPAKDSLYTFVRRDDEGKLTTVPYRVQLKKWIEPAAEKLRAAAKLAESAAFRRYLNLRADALLNDDYQPSDFAWLEMKDNEIDVVIGPIETYEDALYGYKAAHECYVLLKDLDWSRRLAKYAQYLPELQRNLPVDEKYKQEEPGSDTDLNAYDVLYYAGDCNAGSKTIAINLPNDEEVQLARGTRRLQLKNAMLAKYEKILLPIADELIVEEQREMINFEAFFSNTMFHEVAHGLGIKHCIDGSGTVREALKHHASTIEEGKADILGLFMIQQLHAQGEIEEDLNTFYTTFLAGIFRSVRFGAASAHGRANMIRFNFFQSRGAFSRDADGRYRVHPDRFAAATEELAGLLLKIQGDGDFEAAEQLLEEQGNIENELQKSLDQLTEKGIPVDVVFEQGLQTLGLE